MNVAIFRTFFNLKSDILTDYPKKRHFLKRHSGRPESIYNYHLVAGTEFDVVCVKKLEIKLFWDIWLFVRRISMSRRYFSK